MQKKLSQSKNVNSKRTHPSNNLSQNNDNILLTKKNTINNFIEPSSLPKYINHMMSKEEENNIRNALKNHFVFKKLNLSFKILSLTFL